MMTRLWVWLVSALVPGEDRAVWREEWLGELGATDGSMRQAWGALPDAWCLRTDGWTMEGMLRDVRIAVRGLIRRPLFTAVAGITLAVGIGANTAIFSVVDAVLINPLPYPSSQELVSYNHEAPGLGVNVPVIPHSEALYLHYLENAKSLESFAVFDQRKMNLIIDDEPQRLDANRVTQQYFDVIGIPPLLGRTFAVGEDRPGSEPVVVLGQGLWDRAYGKDPGVIGRLLDVNGVQRRVIGVMPDDARFGEEELWVPLVIDPANANEGALGLVGAARLADGVTVAAANAEMHELLIRFSQAHSDEFGPEVLEQAKLDADVKPLKDLFVESTRQILWVLLGTVGFVLLIACANVANLFLVRAEGRQREQAVRTAMGASRRDVIRQYLVESVALAALAGIAGLGLAHFGVKGLLALAPTELPNVLKIGIDGSVLAFTAAISLGAGVFFGVFPVFAFARKDLSGTLRDGSRSATVGRERHRVRSGLVVAQVALALVLLVGSGLTARSFLALRGVDLGFQPTNRLTFAIGLSDVAYPDVESVTDFYRRLGDRIAADPRVVGVGIINGLPLTGAKSAGPMEPEDDPLEEGQIGPVVEQRRVTPGYFEAMGIEIVDGRAPEWSDRVDEGAGVVIGKKLADAFWPGSSAVGRRIRSQGDDFSWEVVGVAADVRFDDVSEEALTIIYYPVFDSGPGSSDAARAVDVVMHTAGDPMAAIDGVRQALRELDPRLPMVNPRTVEDIVRTSMASTSFTVLLLGIAAGIALLLGTVGIYGVISYVVSRRTAEIGVRIALGAPAATVLRSVVGQGLRLTALGVAIGLLGAWGLSRVLASLLYGVTATDPTTFTGTSLVLIVVATLATYVPARRASRVDPVEALRAE
jgi:putative ABC transport system permease protein